MEDAKDFSQKTDSTSTSLLIRVKSGNEAAWRRMSDLYAPTVYAWVRHSGIESNGARDIVQDVFRAVFTGIDGFNRIGSGKSFRAWLRTITRNKINDYLRQRQRQPLAFGGSDAHIKIERIPSQTPSTGGAADDRVENEIAQRAIELMKTDFEEKTWQAFYLTAVDGRPPADVAEELGLSVTSVYTAKSRVLKRLREEFAGLLD